MTIDTKKITKRIAKMNDAFRMSVLALTLDNHDLEKVYCTSGITTLPNEDVLVIANKVRLFDAFNKGNDPYGEHDFGEITHNDQKIFWKIDYEDPTLEYEAIYVPETEMDNRKLTIMSSHEW